MSLNYRVTQTKVQIPTSLVVDETMIVYLTSWTIITAKSHIATHTVIQLAILISHVATISIIVNPSPCKSLVAPEFQP